MENQNAYEKPVTLGNILKFAIPTIAMTVFMSFYTMVDGLFVSNLIGTDALSAINLTAPVIQLVTAVSTMLATGGSAVIMRKMGEHKSKEAREDFTFLILVNILVGIVMSVLGYLLTGRLFAGMSLSPKVEGYCVEYLSKYLYDCQREGYPLSYLLGDRRRPEHGFGLCVYRRPPYGNQRRGCSNGTGILGYGCCGLLCF